VPVFRTYKSLLLVLLQFIFIGIIFATGRVFPSNKFLAVLFITGISAGLYAIIIMKFNFNIAPDLKNGAILIFKGPYRYIRHPMYTSVLTVLLSLLIDDFSLIRLIFYFGLAVVIIIKMKYEENILMAEFEDYKNYMSGTKRLIPFIY